MKIFKMCLAVVLEVEIAGVSLESRSVNASMYCLIYFMLGKGPMISIVVMSKGPGAGKSHSLRRWQYFGLFLVQIWQELTMWSTAAVM